MLTLYKESIFGYSKDYEVLMLDVENVGYDATGKFIEGSELNDVAKKIKDFISKVQWLELPFIYQIFLIRNV